MPARKAPRGFTLIELLVVIAILGILSTVAALSITPNPRRAATEDAQRLALLLEAALAEAQAGQRLLAWSAEAEGYGFWAADNSNEHDRRWQPLTEDERFRSRRFAEGLRLTRVEIDGQPLQRGGLMVFRRGDPPLYRILLEEPRDPSHPANSIELRGLPTGRVEITAADVK